MKTLPDLAKRADKKRSPNRRKLCSQCSDGIRIIHSPDGTHITASNQYGLEAAAERFIKSSRRETATAKPRLSTSFNLAR